MADGIEDGERRQEEPLSPERLGDSLRAAVERTMSATAGSASETRQRAQGLLDDVVRAGRLAGEDLKTRGATARDEVTRRGEVAGSRISGAVTGLRGPDEPPPSIIERLAEVERRIALLEQLLTGEPQPEVEDEEAPPPAPLSGPGQADQPATAESGPDEPDEG